MLFHTWPFLVFMLVVLPVFYALRRTRLWIFRTEGPMCWSSSDLSTNI